MVALRPEARLPVAPRQLDGPFVRLCPRVREEAAPSAAEEMIEAGGEPRLVLVVVEVGDVQERARLVGERLGDRRVRVPERRDGQAREEVEVPPTFGVPQQGPLAPRERHRQTPVGLHDVRGVDLDEVAEHTHGCTIVPTPSRVKNSSSSA